MSNVLINDTQAHEGPAEVGFNQRSGFSTTRTFRGSESYIRAKELELRMLGYNTTVTEGPVFELRAQISLDARDDGEPEKDVDRWEIVKNVSEKDILESDCSAVAGLSRADLRWLRDVVEGRVDLAEYYAADPATEGANGLKIFKLIMAGVKTQRIYQPVLKHTKTISQQRQIDWAFTGIFEVFSCAKVIQLEGLSASLANAMNANASGYIEHTTLGNAELYKGWMKMPPEVVDAAGSKVQVVQEWEWGWWPATLYTINA